MRWAVMTDATAKPETQPAAQQDGLTSDDLALIVGRQLLQLAMNAKQIIAQQARIAELEAAKVTNIKEAKA